MITIHLYGGPADGAKLERESTWQPTMFIEVPAVPVSVGSQSLASGYCRHIYEQETILGNPVVTVLADGQKYYRYTFLRTDH